MKIHPFFSSSSGNCTLITSGDRGLLIDCGVPLKQIKLAVDKAGFTMEQIVGVLLTHEHNDHIKAIPQLIKHYSIPFYGTRGTLQAAEVEGTDHQNQPFSVGDFQITPIETSHDVASPCGYRISAEGKCISIVTDTGKITPSMMQALSGCSLIMLESNYDPELLEYAPYPDALKRRIRSDRGHLSNNDCASMLALKALEGDLQTAVLAHLSDHSNTPLTAKMAVLDAFAQYGIEDIQLEVGGPFCPVLEV